MKKIQSALLSLYHKDNLQEIASLLTDKDVKIFATGGTYDSLIKANFKATPIEAITSYPSILGGRVKTLHPLVFGGILARRNNTNDHAEMLEYKIPPIDLVIVDLYPFEETVKSGAIHEDIIEKIDIGGISLIRAAAKNYADVVIIPSNKDLNDFIQIFKENNGCTSLEQRKHFAKRAFAVSSNYDNLIYQYFADGSVKEDAVITSKEKTPLRYGENPHQTGVYHGNLNDCFEQLNGKQLSYNNILDIDAAIQLIAEFDEPTFAIIKHNNACGIASASCIKDAYQLAFASDTKSAFGGILIANRTIDEETAITMQELFFEVIVAPDFEKNALEILKQKKNRIILQQKKFGFSNHLVRTALDGLLEQSRDTSVENAESFTVATLLVPSPNDITDLIFANKVVKHLKSNAIAIVKSQQLIGMGAGQTSRVDAVQQAIKKAKEFGFDLHGAVLASDAFFPFADSVALAHQEGINAIIQPGGSINDKESIAYCNANQMKMIFTGVRHFKH